MTTIRYRTLEGVEGSWSVASALSESEAREFLTYHHPQYVFLGTDAYTPTDSPVVTKAEAYSVEAAEVASVESVIDGDERPS